MKTIHTRLGVLAALVVLVMVGVTSTTASARESATPTAQHLGTTALAKSRAGSVTAPVRFRSADGSFRGHFRPHRVTVAGDQMMVTGRVIGKVTKTGHKAQQVNRRVSLPVQTVDGLAPDSAGAQRSKAAAAGLTCDVLNLVLGPLDLNVLGLQIHLDTVVLDIVANPAGGLLGQLLCALANLLSGGLGLPLAQLAALLTAILAALGL